MQGPETPTIQNAAERDTRIWLERAVIGLNLCPFAKAVHARSQIHFALSKASDTATLRADLACELKDLVAMNPSVRETTLLIAPHCLGEFWAFNEFLGEADQVLEELGLEGVIQVASFHPDYQFAGTREDDITNCSNRSPYPTLHLLREASVERAVQAFPQAETIFEANMRTLRSLGPQGWAALDVGARP